MLEFESSCDYTLKIINTFSDVSIWIQLRLYLEIMKNSNNKLKSEERRKGHKLRSQSKPSMMQAGQALAVQILTSDFTVWVLISRL